MIRELTLNNCWVRFKEYAFGLDKYVTIFVNELKINSGFSMFEYYDAIPFKHSVPSDIKLERMLLNEMILNRSV
jgi:hypothetical protein